MHSLPPQIRLVSAALLGLATSQASGCTRRTVRSYRRSQPCRAWALFGGHRGVQRFPLSQGVHRGRSGAGYEPPPFGTPSREQAAGHTTRRHRPERVGRARHQRPHGLGWPLGRKLRSQPHTRRHRPCRVDSRVVHSSHAHRQTPRRGPTHPATHAVVWLCQSER